MRRPWTEEWELIDATIRVVRRLRWTAVLVRGQDDLTSPTQYTVSEEVATLAVRRLRRRGRAMLLCGLLLFAGFVMGAVLLEDRAHELLTKGRAAPGVVVGTASGYVGRGRPDHRVLRPAGPGAHRRAGDRQRPLLGFLRAGTRVLEIGTGWGALAIRAARRGAHVTTLTISAEQKALAEQRIAEAGVGDRVRVLLRDYRDADGAYDAVVSVEMIEAVGRDYWPTYFRTLDRVLAPGGRVGLQAITMPHDRLLATRHTYTWIHKYVFPGGQLLSVPSVEDAVRQHTGLAITHRRSLGPDYATTLRHWRTRFLAEWDQVATAGFDATFRRMWEFYLAYCEAGFRSGYLDVWQFSMTKDHR